LPPRIVPPPQIIPQNRDAAFPACDLLRGPTLKINRLSDISLPLSPEERQEIERKRAANSMNTGAEDFDLVLRLGTFRHPAESTISAQPDIHVEGEGHNPQQEEEEILSAATVDQDLLKSPTSVLSLAIPSPTASHFREPKGPVSKKVKRRTSRKFRRTNKSKSNNHSTSSKDDPSLRPMLSEDNLAKLTKLTGGTSPPPMPSPISIVLTPTSSRSISSQHRIRTTPMYRENTGSTLSVPMAGIPPAARKRLLSPDPDQLPLAQTTALGLKGGRIGVVQMGSASKANKILGDVVLIVPDGAGRGRKKMGRAPSVRSAMSLRKVERLRGEKVTAEMVAGDALRPKSKGAVWVV
jgi:hypothetical protein